MTHPATDERDGLSPEQIVAKLLTHSKGPSMHPALQDDIMEAAACILRLAERVQQLGGQP